MEFDMIIEEGSTIPFREGYECEMKITGIGHSRAHRGNPMGKHRGVRMIINDHSQGGKFEAFPGDRALVRVTGIDHNHAHVTVVEKREPFVEELTGHCDQILITGRSLADARNMVSDPRDIGGGTAGMMVVINNCKVPGYGPLYKRANVNLEGWTKRKFGYILFGELDESSKELKRDPEKSLFYAWKTTEFPSISEFAEIKGVPKKLGVALYLEEDRKRILFKSNEQDVSRMSIESAISCYKGKLREYSFPLVVYNSLSIESKIVSSAEKLGFCPEEPY